MGPTLKTTFLLQYYHLKWKNKLEADFWKNEQLKIRIFEAETENITKLRLAEQLIAFKITGV